MPPLLVPAIAFDRVEANTELLDACERTVRAVANSAEQVVVVAPALPGGTTGDHDPDLSVSFHGFGVDDPPHRPSLPWPLGLGAWLLDCCDYLGPRRYIAVGPGDRIDLGEATNVGLLVLGDGSACSDPRSRPPHDDQATEWDHRLGALLEAADVGGMAALDPKTAEPLISSAAITWPIAAQLLGERRWRSDLRYDAAPHGIRYWVALWSD